MRRGMLAVPPAPGTSPRPSSGRAITRVGRGDDVVGERRHLDAGAHARPVQVHVQPVGELVGEPGRAARQARDVGRRRVGERAELGEVAAAAERRPVAGQVHGGDRVVGGGERQRLGQPVAQRGRHGVVAARPVERDVQLVADAVDEHRRLGSGGSARSPPRRRQAANSAPACSVE